MSKICQISPTDRFIKLLTSFMDDLLALCCSSNDNFVYAQSIGIWPENYLFGSICVPISRKWELKELKNIFMYNMYTQFF